jgi:hypothetical protein
MYYLGKRNKKTSLHMFSTDAIFSPEYFDPWLPKSTDAEVKDMERWLYSLKECSTHWASSTPLAGKTDTAGYPV